MQSTIATILGAVSLGLVKKQTGSNARRMPSISIPADVRFVKAWAEEVLLEPDDEESMLQKSLSILDGNNTNIKKNKKFLKSKMCQETINFYNEIIT